MRWVLCTGLGSGKNKAGGRAVGSTSDLMSRPEPCKFSALLVHSGAPLAPPGRRSCPDLVCATRV